MQRELLIDNFPLCFANDYDVALLTFYSSLTKLLHTAVCMNSYSKDVSDVQLHYVIVSKFRVLEIVIIRQFIIILYFIKSFANYDQF